MSQQKITKDDLEDTLRSFQGGVTDELENRKRQIAIGLGLVAALVLLVVYVAGRRRGRRKSTFVEIRRF